VTATADTISAYAGRTTSPEGTKRLAATLAPLLRAGDVVVLSGGLGAGKTQFVQGVASGLGVREQVTSPTFNILLDYVGTSGPALCHFDLYRLDDESQLEDVGYFETVGGPGAVFIEWGEKFPAALPEEFLEVAITAGTGQERRFSLRAHGARPAALLAAWALDPASGLEPA